MRDETMRDASPRARTRARTRARVVHYFDARITHARDACDASHRIARAVQRPRGCAAWATDDDDACIHIIHPYARTRERANDAIRDEHRKRMTTYRCGLGWR
jgi:hypothetical protein